MRIGPVRDAALLEHGDLATRSSTRSSATSDYAKHPDDRGGWAIGHLGPVPEGLVTWLIGGGRARRRLRRDRHGGCAREARPKELRSSRCSRCCSARGRRPRESRGRIVDRRAGRTTARGARRARAARLSRRCARRRASSSSTRSTARAPDAVPRPRARARRCSSFAAALIVDGAEARRRPRSSRTTTRRTSTRDEQERVAQLVEEAARGITRRRLFKLGLLGAGGALGARAARAGRSRSGRCSTRSSSSRTPWRRGRRLVDENGRPWRAADIEETTSTPRSPRAPTTRSSARRSCVVRLPPGELALPRELRGYDADGIVAYSKICTHAGCAISLYRAPLFAAGRAAAGARLPVPLLDVRPGDGRHGHLRPGRPHAADAAARDRREAATCARRGTSTGRSGRRGGASACGGRRRDPQRRPLSRPAQRHRAVHPQDAALPLPRPLVVPARRGRAVRVHRARRDRHLPDALLRRQHAPTSSTTGRTRRCRGST